MKFPLLLILITLISCSGAPEGHQLTASLGLAEQEQPTRRQLIRKQYDLGELTFVYSATSAEERKKWGNIVAGMSQSAGRGLKINFKAADEISESELEEKALYFVGTVENNPWLAKLKSALPFQITADKLTFGEKEYADKAVLQISLFPNPKNKKLPIYICTGIDETALQNYVQWRYKRGWQSLLWASHGYQIYEEGECRMTGFFSAKDWQVDKQLHWEFDPADHHVEQTAHFNFIQHQPGKDNVQIERIKKLCEANFSKIQKFTGIKKEFSKIDYHIHDGLENKGMMMDNTWHCHLDERNNKAHVIHHSAFDGNLIQQENQLILNGLIGSPKTAALARGLSIYFAPAWQKRGYAYWAKLLRQSNNLPPLTSIFNEQQQDIESPIILGAMEASFVASLIDKWGREEFLNKYTRWIPDAKEIIEMETDWLAYIDELPAVTISKKNAALPYLKGFNFAHEGYQIYNGYGSDLADQSMERMVQIGSNAVAIVPYSYMSAPDKPMAMPLRHGAGSETDEAVIQSIQHAKDKGCYVLLKPQLWLGRSWTGFIDMKNQQDWDTFFEDYTRWIRHYALLAEIYEVDALSVGVEFVLATLQNQERWKSLFKNIRSIYSGQLTYCANWGEEFEQLDFWEDLDYIGLNCYYPWSKEKKASKKELQKGLQKIMAKIGTIAEQKQKPIVFTEIGFRSVTHPWINPHAEAGDRAYEDQAQQYCYDQILQSIKGQPWCKGILWWKWPTYQRNPGEENTGFTPLGKAAEQVVKKHFTAK